MRKSRLHLKLLLASEDGPFSFRDLSTRSSSEAPGEHANVDALSRLPLLVVPKVKTAPPELVLLTEHLDNSPVTATQIKLKVATAKDRQLCQVIQFLQKGRPVNCPSDDL